MQYWQKFHFSAIVLLLGVILWLLTYPLQITNATLRFSGPLAVNEKIELPFAMEGSGQPSSFVVSGSLYKYPLQSTLIRLVPDDCLDALTVNSRAVTLPASSKKRCWPESITVDLAEYLQPGPNRIRMEMTDKGWLYGIEANTLSSRVMWLLVAIAILLALPGNPSLSGVTVKTWICQWYKQMLVIAVSLAIAVTVKYSIIDFEGGDYKWFLAPWLNHIRHYGLLAAYGFDFSNYAPLYTYLLGIFDLFFPTMPDLYAIKAVSIIGEAVAGYYVYRLIAMYRGERSLMALAGALSVFYMPSFIANSTSSGQCDIWYSACMLATVYYVLRQMPARALFLLGLGVSFKLQAIWLTPFVFICLWKGLIPWRLLWIIPATFVLTQIPAWIEGRDFVHLMLIYWRQFNTYHNLGNAANPYSLMDNALYDLIRNVGLLTAMLVCFVFVCAACRRWKIPVTATSRESLIIPAMILATLSVMLVPYTLPKMLDRYFFPAELFSLVLFWIRPWWIMTWLIQFATLLTYPDWQFPWVKYIQPETYRQAEAVAFCSVALLMLLWQFKRHFRRMHPVTVADMEPLAGVDQPKDTAWIRF